MRTTLLLMLSTALCCAQQPHWSNAKLENRTLNGGFAKAFEQLVASQAAPAWVGYAVRMAPGKERMCCWDSNHMSVCALENRNGGISVGQAAAPSMVRLEGPRWMSVLYRVEAGKVGKIRVFSEECTVDAGGLPVVWLAGVGAQESLAQLAQFAPTQEDAMVAIAFHEDAGADRVLESLAADTQPLKLREKALFWLATARGRRGFEVVKRVATIDASEQIREKCVFALSVSKEAEAVPVMIALAKQDSSERVRGQALFWLAHKAGQKETAAIQKAISDDPSTEVKKKAVFALQQLPEVRKQAMFWLGQTHDPRATAFFEQLLTK
jgi:hypothetical protein